MYETTRVGESPREREQNEKRAKGWVLGKTTFKGLAKEKHLPKEHPGRQEENWSPRVIDLKEG